MQSPQIRIIWKTHRQSLIKIGGPWLSLPRQYNKFPSEKRTKERLRDFTKLQKIWLKLSKRVTFEVLNVFFIGSCLCLRYSLTYEIQLWRLNSRNFLFSLYLENTKCLKCVARDDFRPFSLSVTFSSHNLQTGMDISFLPFSSLNS